MPGLLDQQSGQDQGSEGTTEKSNIVELLIFSTIEDGKRYKTKS